MGKLVTIALAIALTMAPIIAPTPAQASVTTSAPVVAAKKYTTRTSITAHPATVKTTEGRHAIFKVSANGEKLAYQWQLQYAGRGPWKNISRSKELNLKTVSSQDKSNVRVQVKGANGTAVSKTAKLYVSKKAIPTSITSQPRSVSVRERSKADFSVSAKGQNLRYSWQMQTNGKGSWKQVSNSRTLTIANTSHKQNASNIRTVVSGANGTATSKTAKLTVQKPAPKTSITTHPKSAKIYQGQDANFSVKASGQSLKYNWQMQTGGRGGWSSVGNGSSLKISNASTKQNGSRIKVTVRGANGSATSHTATLTVSATPTTKITRHPSSTTVVEGQSHTFSAAATGTGLFYEWQIKYPSSGTWYYFARGSNPQGVLTNIAYSENNAQIRVLAIGDKGYAYSKAAKLTVRKAAKPSISKVSPPRSDYSKSISVSISGKNFQDVYKVQYIGGVSSNLKFRKSGNSISVTIPAEPAPTTSTLVLSSAAGSSSINLTRSRVLSSSQRQSYISSYESQKRVYGTPTGRVGSAVNTALKTIKANPAWHDEAWDASLIIDSGFRYRKYEKERDHHKAELSKVNKEISKQTRRSGEKQSKSSMNQLLEKRSYLNERIDACEREMQSQLTVMRNLGAKV